MLQEAETTVAGRVHQGHHDTDLRQGRHRGIAAPAGAGRFLGAVVRPLQAAHARPRKGREGGQGQGQARQDEHRRAPGHSRPDGHPVDPGRDRLRQRPAGRRLHGRAAGKPGHRLSRTADQGPDRRRGEGSAQGGRCRAGRRAMPRAPPSSIRSFWPRMRSNVPALAGLVRCYVETGALDQAKQTLAQMPEAKRNDAAVAAARAALELAEQAKPLGPVAELEAEGRRQSARSSGALRSRAGAQRQGPAAGRARTPDLDRQARPQMELMTAPASSWCSSSMPGARRTRPRSRAARGCRRFCSRSLADPEKWTCGFRIRSCSRQNS